MFVVKSFCKLGRTIFACEATEYQTPAPDAPFSASVTPSLAFRTPSGEWVKRFGSDWSRIIVENANGKTIENIYIGGSPVADEEDQSANTGSACAAVLIPAAA
jgi:hypothetical protein